MEVLMKYRRFTKTKINKILSCFVNDLGATQTSKLLKINRNTINNWFTLFRIEIAKFQDEEVKQSSGEFELDESYFGGLKKKNNANERRKRGRGAENKVPVFGIKKRDDGYVYIQIIENASKTTLLPIIRKLIHTENSIVYTDKFKSYDGLVFDGYKHQRVNHSKRYSDKKGTHINGIENFWSFAKKRLAKFNGVNRNTFYLHLKESEFRYNKKYDMIKVLRARLREILV
jgi:transposase